MKKNKLYLVKVWGMDSETGKMDWLYPYSEQTVPCEGESYYHAYGTKAEAKRVGERIATKYLVEEYTTR